MTAAGANYAENTNFTASSTTWVDGPSIAAGNFTAGNTYLILALAWVKSSSTSNDALIRLVHGATPTVFTDATLSYDVTATSQYVLAGYMTVWTQPGTAEDIKMQVSSSSTNTSTATLGQIWTVCLNDVGSQGTDWDFNEVTADYTTTVTLTSQASLTFTPNGSDTFLILGNCCTRPGGATDDEKFELYDSVAGSLTLLNVEGEDVTNDIRGHLMAAVVTPTNASHTFSTRHAHETTAGTVFSSRIFWLKLNIFAQFSSDIQAAALALAASPTYTNINTIAPNPAVTGNWFVMNYLEDDVNAATDAWNYRMQIDASGGGLTDSPNYGDDAPGQSRFATTDIQEHMMFNMVSLSSGSGRTINTDGTMTTGTTMRAQNRTLLAVSMELAAAAAGQPMSLRAWDVPGMRAIRAGRMGS